MPPIALSPGGLAEEMKALLRARESRAMPVCKARDLRVQRQGKTPPAKPGPYWAIFPEDQLRPDRHWPVS